MSIGAISLPPPPPVAPVSNAGGFSSAGSNNSQSSASLSEAGRSLASNYQGSVSEGNLSYRQADAAAERFSTFLSVAEQTPGVNIQDGLSGNEYLLVANSISDNPALRDKFQSLDTTIGNARPELYGQYGVDGRTLLDAAGKPNITVDEAATNFNDMMQGKTAATEEAKKDLKAVDAKDAKDSGGGCGGGAGSAEQAGGAGKSGGCGGGSGDFVSLWPFLMDLLDEDGDGKISPEEFMKGMGKLDKNKDGKITKNELMAAGATDEQATQLMSSMDTDGNGTVSLDGSASEVQAFATAANENGDIAISEAELTAALAASSAIPSSAKLGNAAA